MAFFGNFKALGTEVSLWLSEVPERSSQEDFESVKDVILQFEARFSRFSPQSELSRLNAAGGPFEASEEMRTLLRASLDLHKETGGVFDPSIHDALVQAGYNRNFDLITKSNKDEAKDVTRAGRGEADAPTSVFSDIAIVGTTVSLPDGMRIDLGGIGKGYIVDRVADLLLEWGYKNFWVSAGGDMVVSGEGEDGGPHVVGVQDPRSLEHDLFDLELDCGRCAIATSGIAKRVWMHRGKHKHHIIDPATRLSADSGLLAVTVVAKDALHADVYAKVAFILGREKGKGFIDSCEGAESVSIDEGLCFTFSENMRQYIHEDHADNIS